MSFGVERALERLQRERMDYWRDEVRRTVGPSMALTLDPGGLPPDASAIERFDRQGLCALRNALREAMRLGMRDYLASRVSRVHVVVESDAPVPRYSVDREKGCLTVVTTPKEPSWVGYSRLLAFLREEL